MTVRPIAFTGAMVTALLDGRKTQTRRVVSRLQGLGAVTEFGPSDTPGYDWHCRDKDKRWHDLRDPEMRARLPYAVGDLLYVRECWRTFRELDGTKPRDMAAGTGVFYQADANGFYPPSRLRAAMHMPRWASRLTLKVTDVRVERVQQISATDALAEGVSGTCRNLDTGEKAPDGNAAIMNFACLWNSINAARGYSWEENPWVIAISFEVIRQNVDGLLKGEAA